MANAEWEKLKETLKRPATPESMREAAQQFRRYEEAKPPGKRSKPMLVSLGHGKTYPSAIPVDKIPEELEKDPQFYDLMGRIVTKE